ncbi:tetratricopeptide repeat protein [Streptomyces sp. KL118A]|uniref:tetratricopeptide repeat protein n=1 Tax=Streptomyces sp. KL118A TaxID=3045153 RepID=UPI00278BE3B7|nr:tetratricopeptide repeat protein [Streptomyces sp. KL118A]
MGRRLAHEMADGGTAVLGQVLSGTGGVGKTQLAARYARDLLRSGEVDLLLWVTAVKREAVVAAYAQAAEDVLGITLADSEQAAARFLAWLEPRPPGGDGEQGPGWMVVLDDLADPVDLLADPVTPRIALWPPAGPHGRTLVTTRRRDAVLTGHGHRCIDVGLFDREESVAYLTQVLAGERRDPGNGSDPAAAQSPDCIALLAEDLGDLPLALSQAAAYLLETGLDCPRYRTLLAGRTRDLARLVPEPGSLPDAQTVTLAATWSLSVDRADRMRPQGLASPLLVLIALLDPSGIPAAVLTGAAARGYLARHRAGEHPEESVEPFDAVDALRALHRMHLVDYTPGVPHQAVRVHQLVQRSIRETLTRDRIDEAAVAVADALVEAWPEVEKDAALGRALRANADALRSVADGPLWAERAHDVVFRTATSVAAAGHYTHALEQFKTLVGQAVRRLGPDHRDTLRSRLNLAEMWAMSGHPLVAVGELREVVGDTERVCGPDDPDTLRARHSLAHSRALAEDVPGALVAFEQVLCDFQRELGDEAPETLSARSFLALWWGEAGDTAGAIAALEQLIADRERLLGRDHSELFWARHNLAGYRGRAGDTDGAVTAYEELLADRERVLGPDHTDTLASRAEHAYWLRESGRNTEALMALERLVVDMERVLGPGHIELYGVLRSLAFSWEEAGDIAGSVLAHRQQLDELRDTFGPDHATTAEAAVTLTRALIHRGRELRDDSRTPPPDSERRTAMPEETSQSRPARLEQALACFYEARGLTDPEESPGVYGIILHDIADTYRDARDLKEAVEYFRQAVSYKQQADNPSDLATTMTALANTLVAMGERTEARDVLERLTGEVPKIGDTERRAAVLHNMALTHEELGRMGVEGAYADAVAACQAVLALVDGDSDPGWYASVLKDMGDVYDAQDMLPQAHAAYEEAVRYTRRIEGTSTSLITVLIALGRTSRRLGKQEGETTMSGDGAAVNGARFDHPRSQPRDAPSATPADAAPPSDGPPQDGGAAPEEAGGEES